MRIILLSLVFLFSFNSIAVTQKVKFAQSIAGGYSTPLNRVDGGFETSSNSQWVASVGTIVRTASTEFQGNYKGVWSGTGTGTLDLQWTATATNTYEASAQVKVDVAADYQVCAYVNGSETGCKALTSTNISKISVVADSWKSSSFYLRLKHTGSGAFSIDIDDGKIEPWTPQIVGTMEQESITYTGYQSGSTSGVLLRTKESTSNNSVLLSVTQGAYTKYTTLKNSQVTLVFSENLSTTTASWNAIEHYNASGTLIKRVYGTGNASLGSLQTSYVVNASSGDYFVPLSSVTNIIDNTTTSFSITATALRNNVVQAWQDGTEWTSLTYTDVNNLTGNQGLGSFTAGSVEWKRDGSDLLYKGKLTVGTTTAVEARLPLPSGLISADATKIPSIQLLGIVVTSGLYSIYTYEALIEPSVRYMTFGRRDATINGLSKQNGSSIWNSGDQISFSVRIPIQGWSSTPTLLALPTSKENVFSAVVNGDGTIASKSTNWLTVSKGGTGLYNISLNSSYFTGTPAVSLVSHSGYQIKVTAWSGLTISVASANDAISALADSQFSIFVQKQSQDYTPQGVFVGNVPLDAQYDLTVTGTNWTTIRAVGVPYITSDGTWRLTFNIVGTVNSATRSSYSVTIANVTAKNVANFHQTVSAYTNSISAYGVGGTIDANSGILAISHASATTSSYGWSGDIELDGKPSFVP